MGINLIDKLMKNREGSGCDDELKSYVDILPIREELIAIIMEFNARTRVFDVMDLEVNGELWEVNLGYDNLQWMFDLTANIAQYFPKDQKIIKDSLVKSMYTREKVRSLAVYINSIVRIVQKYVNSTIKIPTELLSENLEKIKEDMDQILPKGRYNYNPQSDFLLDYDR